MCHFELESLKDQLIIAHCKEEPVNSCIKFSVALGGFPKEIKITLMMSSAAEYAAFFNVTTDVED